MKIVFMEWNSIGNMDVQQTLEKMGHTVISCPFNTKIGRSNEEWEETFAKTLHVISPDMVFSFNYFPIISTVCNREQALYYSWVYDSPLHALYSNTVYNAYNRIFVFDRESALLLQSMKINTVYYLPLGINVSRFTAMKKEAPMHKQYRSDISFVGSLYTEEKHQLFKRLQTLPDYTCGYLNGLVEIQKNIYGSNIIKEALSAPILEQMQKAYPVAPHDDGFETASDIYTDYFLLREVTARERRENITALGEKYGDHYKLNLYTHLSDQEFPGVSVHSEVDYYNQMPYVFMNSKINLNITLRSIISGIPLRALDILGCGGFLLSNYQADFLDYFEPDVDFVYYENKKDLLEKVQYYLRHEDERQAIARSGHEKVCQNFDYSIMLQKMFEM